jgi:hypothetical protein
MREWLRTIGVVDELGGDTIDAGLFSIETKSRLRVTDVFNSGPECVETVGAWQRAPISSALLRGPRTAAREQGR